MILSRGGTSKACASCKYQRRKCTKDCLLAPYFPSDQPRLFQNAHRLFGVSNMQKLLKRVEPSKRDTAMGTILYQANARAQYPVYGCLEIMHHLQDHIEIVKEELHYVLAQIAVHQGQQQQQSCYSSQFVQAADRSLLCPSEFPAFPGDGDPGVYPNEELEESIIKQVELEQSLIRQAGIEQSLIKQACNYDFDAIQTKIQPAEIPDDLAELTLQHQIADNYDNCMQFDTAEDHQYSNMHSASSDLSADSPSRDRTPPTNCFRQASLIELKNGQGAFSHDFCIPNYKFWQSI